MLLLAKEQGEARRAVASAHRIVIRVAFADGLFVP
jgi:hypothetical protein